MKKIFLNLLSVVLLSFMIIASLAAANNDPISAYLIKTNEAKKLVLNISNMHADYVTCTIKNDYGVIVFSERIKTKAHKLTKKYDLSNLKKGSYSLVIDDLMSVERLSFQLTDGVIEYSNQKAEVIYKPVVWVNTDKTLDFNLLALGNITTVSIYSGLDKLFHQTYKKQSSIAQKFDFSEMPKGQYSIEVKIKGQTFYKHITI